MWDEVLRGMCAEWEVSEQSVDLMSAAGRYGWVSGDFGQLGRFPTVWSRSTSRSTSGGPQ